MEGPTQINIINLVEVYHTSDISKIVQISNTYPLFHMSSPPIGLIHRLKANKYTCFKYLQIASTQVGRLTRKPLLLKYLDFDMLSKLFMKYHVMSSKRTTACATERNHSESTGNPEAFNTRGQGHTLPAYVAKTQALKTRWQGHLLQPLVEVIAEAQALKTRWQGHPLQALVEHIAKTQALKTR